jgi:RNA polymerase sigma factor (sigma-70 family)
VDVRERLAELYVEHAPSAGKLAYLLTGDRDLAADLTQEAFARVARGLRGLRNEDAFGWYLRRTIVNLARRQWRQNSRRRAFEQEEGHRVARAIMPDQDLETRDVLWRVMHRLPYRQRAAIALRYYEDLSEQEIASVLRCAPGTVKSLIFRGLRTMRAELEDQL